MKFEPTVMVLDAFGKYLHKVHGSCAERMIKDRQARATERIKKKKAIRSITLLDGDQFEGRCRTRTGRKYTKEVLYGNHLVTQHKVIYSEDRHLFRMSVLDCLVQL